jgi:hypothetical protein
MRGKASKQTRSHADLVVVVLLAVLGLGTGLLIHAGLRGAGIGKTIRPALEARASREQAGHDARGWQTDTRDQERAAA